MFDTNGSESITLDEFLRIIKHSTLMDNVKFDLQNSEFIRMHFGRDKKRAINYLEFSQLLHEFHFEVGIQAFKQFDSNNTGYIKAVDFQQVMTSVKPHMLSNFVRTNLISVAGKKFIKFDD